MEDWVNMGNDKKLKILMINDSYREIGGVGRYIKIISEKLKERGHEIYLFALSDNNLETKNIKLFKYKYKDSLQRFISENLINFKLYMELRSYIKKINPDVIHFNNIGKSKKSFLFASRGFKKIHILHDFSSTNPYHDIIITNKNLIPILPIKYKNLRYYKSKNKDLIGLFFDFYLFNNPLIEKLFINKFISSSREMILKLRSSYKVRIEHLFYPIEKFNKNPRFNFNNILFIGRLVEQKGVSYLLEAFKIARNKNKKLRLIIIGYGDDFDIINKYAKYLKIDKYVKFTGNIDYNLLDKYYNNSFVLLIPSIWEETSPLVAYKAMANAKPIIAFNVGAIPDILKDGYNGFLVKKYDISGLAESILFLSKNEKVAKRLGMNGFKLAENKFDINYYTNSLIEIYKSL